MQVRDGMREGVRPVVVGVDGSDSALAAARYAAGEARRRGVPLHLVTAVPWPYDGLAAAPPSVDLPGLLHRNAQLVAEAAAEAADLPGAVVDVRDGDAVDVLTDLSAEAELVVLGSRGIGGVAGLPVGSTASAVVAHAHCPVVVLPADTTVRVRGRRSVVAGVAGRAGDEDVLAFAFAEATACGTDLLAVHTWEDDVLAIPVRTPSPLIDEAGVRADEERVLSEALAGWREKEPGVDVREAVVRDRAARGLVAASMTAELLVVGHRARRGLGSTTHSVLNRATCPVAVVPLTRAETR
jgi:nucleotide-binding universal stress UspA family protein